MQTRRYILVGLCGALLAACSQMPVRTTNTTARGSVIYAKECAQCHGAQATGAGPESLGLGVAPPDLTRLSIQNDGAFPREFVRRFVMGLLENDALEPTMPEFSVVGLRHVYPQGGADGEVLEADFEDLLDYLESIQVSE